MDNVSDIIIIGGGPTGLYGAFYSGMRSMSCKIIDSLPQLGGQLAALYPKKYIYDVPGFTKVLAEDLVNQLSEQATQFNPEICLNEKVVKLEGDRMSSSSAGQDIREQGKEDNSILKLTTDKGNTHFGKSVIVAAGAGAFMSRKLDVQKVDELEGHGFHYFVKDLEQFRGKELLIIGGGDSAADWGLNLVEIAKKITLIHRSTKFRAHEDSVKKLFNSSVKILTNHELKILHGADQVEGVTIFDNISGNESEIKVDAVLCNLGFITNLGPLKKWGFELEKNAIQVSQTMETNIKGVWAAGDIVIYPGKLKLISTAFADSAVAVNMAKSFIDPKAKIFPGHSSSKKETFKF